MVSRRFVKDGWSVLTQGFSSEYHIADRWENFRRQAPFITEALVKGKE